MNTWTLNNIDVCLIKEALKIALNDGVYSLKYIDKVLLDWSSRGIVNVGDLEKKASKEENIDDSLDMELDDWNWLDDEEEYIVN